MTRSSAASGGIATPVATSKGGTGTATTFTQGSVVYAGPSGNYAQDNAKFSWDDTNFALTLNGTRIHSTGTTSLYIGNTAGTLANTGTSNLGIGDHAMHAITSGQNNLAIGTQAGYKLTSGNQNFALGSGALFNCTTHSGNVAIGYDALASVDQGFNVAIGSAASVALSSGQKTIAIGANAMASGDSCTDIICIGDHSGTNSGGGSSITGGQDSIFIGSGASANSVAPTDRVAIGKGAVSDADHQVMLGASGVLEIVAGGLANLGSATHPLKQLFLDYTNTATVGNVTINKASGTVNLAAGVNPTLTLTNSLIATTSRLKLTLAGDPGAATGPPYYVLAGGSAVIGAYGTFAGNQAVSFEVTN